MMEINNGPEMTRGSYHYDTPSDLLKTLTADETLANVI